MYNGTVFFDSLYTYNILRHFLKTSFHYRIPTDTMSDLLKVGRVRRSRSTATSRFFVTRGR